MQSKSPMLFIEIDKIKFNFVVGKNLENNDFKIIHKFSTPVQGIIDNKIIDFNLIFEIFSKNIFLIEQKINHVFEEVVIVINNFDCSLINFSGFKKLNGSQLVKENVTYILNALKSKISEIESDKVILQIFNSNFFLDGKKTENLPIGLFGNFYSHELSFFLINKNDFQNLSNILNKCNLKIKKIISKNFIEGVCLINNNSNLDSFFSIKIEENNSQITFFENSALRYVQNFNFGSEIVFSDISKITGIKKSTIKKMLPELNFNQKYDDEVIEKKFFEVNHYRKINKKLIFEVVKARISEMTELIALKNINITSFMKKKYPIFLSISDELSSKTFNKIYENCFSQNKNLKVNFLNNLNREQIFTEVNKIVQYGWKKEAVPIIQEKKSIISRLFDIIFRS